MFKLPLEKSSYTRTSKTGKTHTVNDFRSKKIRETKNSNINKKAFAEFTRTFQAGQSVHSSYDENSNLKKMVFNFNFGGDLGQIQVEIPGDEVPKRPGDSFDNLISNVKDKIEKELFKRQNAN